MLLFFCAILIKKLAYTETFFFSQWQLEHFKLAFLMFSTFGTLFQIAINVCPGNIFVFNLGT
jgi:hypothetical protein